jgi:hypothetical protein
MSKPDARKTPVADEALAQRLSAPSGTEAYAQWLYTWSNYKSWADKMRSDWQNEDEKKR